MFNEHGDLPVVKCAHLVDDLHAARNAAMADAMKNGRALPDTVVMDRWHFECLLVWAIERWGADERSQELTIHGLDIVPGDPLDCVFVLTRRVS